MGSAFHMLCPRYSRPLSPTVPTASMLWETFQFMLYLFMNLLSNNTSMCSGPIMKLPFYLFIYIFVVVVVVVVVAAVLRYFEVHTLCMDCNLILSMCVIGYPKIRNADIT